MRIPKCGRKGGRGFSLIVTLLMSSLFVVVAMATMGLSAIELRRTGMDAARQQATANARLALVIAIGELQKELGPDKRISAPSGQSAEDGGASRHWVGTYESWDREQEERPARPVFRRWLVSGSTSVVTDPEAPSKNLPLAKKTVVMFRPPGGEGGEVKSDKVEAGLVNLESKGAYAWWISDNSMKATLGNTLDDDLKAETVLANLQAAPRANHQPLFVKAIAPSHPGWNKVHSLKTASFLGEMIPSYFHHASNVSDGLVTDVRKGGFRSDLSLLMEQPLAQMDRTPLYTAGKSKGASLYQLWAAHHVWGEVRRSGLPVHADGMPLPAGAPFLIPPATSAEALKDSFFSYRQLTKVQFTTLYSLITEEKTIPGDPAKAYDLFLVLDPIYTIWNPFDVAVTIPPSAYTLFKNWGIPYNLNLTIRTAGGNKTFTKSIQDLVRHNYMNSAVGKGQPLVMRPGEVQMLSQSYEGKISALNGIPAHDAKLGWNFGAGYKFPIDIKSSVPVLRAGDFITYGMTPNDKSAVLNYALVSTGHSVVTGSTIQHMGSCSVDFRYPQDFRTKASAHPEVFPSLPNDPSAGKAAKDLVSGRSHEKWPICVFSIGFRTEQDSAFDGIDYSGPRFSGKCLYRNNPKAYAWDLSDLSPEFLRASPMQIGMRRVNSLLDNNIANCSPTGLGYFGLDHFKGTSCVVTHSIPTAPVHSLGALQHAIPALAPDVAPGEAMRSFLPLVSHPISNSFAPSIMGPGATKGAIGSGIWLKDTADHSYFLNRELWDSYFYSSISPTTSEASKDPARARAEQREALRKFAARGEEEHRPLPNSRFKPAPSFSEERMDDVFPSSSPSLELAKSIGRNLMIGGMFNVNSVSVEAWKSFLSSLKGSQVPVRPAENPGETPTMHSPKGTPVLSGLVASGKEIESGSISDPFNPEQWKGFRDLTDQEIDELAKAVVKQVKLRGPFLSLSDFVNRRPGSDKKLALSGALQSALDDPSVSINAGFRESGRARGGSEAQGFEFPEAEDGVKAVGAPGYVKQADLLTPLGPLISVRGDTFTIRTCGEAHDKGGKVLSRVYCEAIVQRFPDYVDGADDASVFPPASEANKTFGRRFHIISLRYLNHEEIN